MYGVMSGAVVQLDNACLLSFFDWPVKNEHKISWHDLDWPVKDEHKITWHDLIWDAKRCYCIAKQIYKHLSF